MALHDVRQVFVVQDRETGSFVDINMTFVTSFRHAARVESRQLACESMNFALFDGGISCPEGYDVHCFYELRGEHE